MQKIRYHIYPTQEKILSPTNKKNMLISQILFLSIYFGGGYIAVHHYNTLQKKEECMHILEHSAKSFDASEQLDIKQSNQTYLSQLLISKKDKLLIDSLAQQEIDKTREILECLELHQ